MASAATTALTSASPDRPHLRPEKQQQGGSIPKSKRKLQKHLRSAGLAYISRTGKLIPAKRVADELCQCPQKCDERVPLEARERLFDHFYGMGEADLQNQFLRQNMDLRARLNVPETTESGRPPRRITCKYLVPLLPTNDYVEVCQKAFVSAFVITTKRVRLQREKLISSLGLNSYSSHNRGVSKASPTDAQKKKNNNNNNNNNNSASSIIPLLKLNLPASCDIVSETNNFFTNGLLRQQEPKIVTVMRDHHHHVAKKRLVDNPLIPFGLLVPEGVTIAPVTNSLDHDRDIAIVNNFFSNQLWKPEYIGRKGSVKTLLIISSIAKEVLDRFPMAGLASTSTCGELGYIESNLFRSFW